MVLERFRRAARDVPIDTVRAHARWWRAELASLSGLSRRKPGSTRTALLLAPSFPPHVSGGSYRPLSLAQHGPRLGWDMVVVGPGSENLPDAVAQQLLASVPSSVLVAQMPPESGYARARLLPRIDGKFHEALAMVDAARRALGSRRPTVVIASGPPFHAFVAGYYLAKVYRCRLVLDYRDEWTECPFDFVNADGSDHFWEKRCLRAADLAVFVTRSQLEHHMRTFPFVQRDRCVVIPNGWDDEGVDWDRPVQTTAPDRRVTLSFVGGLGPFAEPGVFVSALADVLRRRPDLATSIRLRLVGKKDHGVADELGRFPFPEVIDLVDHVPVPDAISAMRSSTALLLLNPPTFERSITGKLLNYIASGRPVLVFGEGGEIAALVGELGAGVVIPANSEALERALDDIVNGTFGPERGDGIDEWLATHSRTAIAERYFNELGKLTA
jgi:glycosyltransferase involved in cell wall biosynthesis